jgi:hypothetical protein
MIRLSRYLISLAASAQAMPITPLHQPDGMITQVQACGAGRVGSNGVCVARTTKRLSAAVRMCARWHGALAFAVLRRLL